MTILIVMCSLMALSFYGTSNLQFCWVEMLVVMELYFVGFLTFRYVFSHEDLARHSHDGMVKANHIHVDFVKVM